MDPILAAQALPRIAERAMRAAILDAVAAGRMTPRSLVDRALVGFERAARRSGALRPAPLFAERDRIARELRAFIDGKLCARLRALRRADVVAIGAPAKPFDLLVRNRRGRLYAVVFRRLPRDGRRLERFARMREAAQQATRTPVYGVLVYDFSRGAALLLNQTGAQGVYRYLRAS